MEKQPERKPHIITDAREARVEYQKLTAMQFEVRKRGVVLKEAEFTEALANGIRVDVRMAGWVGETIHQGDWDYMEEILEYAKSNPSEIYEMLAAADYEPYIQGGILNEAEFIEIAKNQGSIDLVRLRLDTKGKRLVARYFGTRIGSSNALVLIVSKGKDGEFVN